jgi:hypothetical protein
MKIIHLFYLIIFISPGLFGEKKLSTAQLIQPLIDIKKFGEANNAAIETWPKVANLPVEEVLSLLKAMNQANHLGDNWIRAALSKICEKNKNTLPIKLIIEFTSDTTNKENSRKTAYEIIQTHNPELATKLAPSFIDDPAPSLRRISVALLIDQINDLKSESKKQKLLHYALNKAREVEQIKEINDGLKSIGQSVNITKLMGFLVDWHTVGPFDNVERTGFEKKFQPEAKSGLDQKYENKSGMISWLPLSTTEEFGMLDINKQYGEIKEVCAYAQAIFISEKSQPAHFRMGSKNAWKLWLNGELLFARDEYHRGKTLIDQFVIDGNLKKGKNLILLKICQNEQTQTWTKQWEFNFRVTDRTGFVIHSNKNNSN